MIEEAASNRKIAMHQPVIATSLNGMAHMRTVVLRRTDKIMKSVYFHTDYRSLKIDDIKLTNQLSWLFYDQNISVQIRLSGPTVIHHKDEVALHHWQKTGHHSRRCYIQTPAPSTVVEHSTSGLDKHLKDFDYTLEESEAGYENFSVIETKAEWMEWFYVHHDGNRRARFIYHQGEIKTSDWLIP